MLAFFRKIRKALIDSGSARKYLIYAIGEIALVVIGILIALQINNWNEQNKSNAYELRLLKGVHSSIENELTQWDFILNNNIAGDSIYAVIVDHFDDELPYTESLNKDFRKGLSLWYHELNNTAFETIKGYGLNFIESQKTVDQLSDMYERWHKIYAKTNRDAMSFYNSVAAPYLFDVFERKYKIGGSEFIPIDYQSLLKDKKFRSILDQQQINRIALIRWQKLILEEMHESLELLDAEINRY